MDLDKLKNEIKELIVNECEKDITSEEISDTEVLFGSDTKLELDSLDALQISMALEKKYAIKITDTKKLRKVMINIESLAKYIDETK